MPSVSNEMPNGAKSLLASLPYDEFDSVLDVGTGNGYSAESFAERGKDVTATVLGEDKWGRPSGGDVEYVQANVESLPFQDGKFDAVWCSHVLEHVRYPGVAFEEVRRVLDDRGHLFVSLPPFKPMVVGGHLNTGWTPGQLMYVLLRNGFAVRDGAFYYRGYNVHGRATKMSEEEFERLEGKLTYDGDELKNLREYFLQEAAAEIEQEGHFSGHGNFGQDQKLDERLQTHIAYLNRLELFSLP